MKQKILVFLKQQEGYVSGQEISNVLGVSRTAIWKYINALREEGYEIESMTRKGYRLLKTPDLLTTEEVQRYLEQGLITGELAVFSSLDSTNEEAKRAFLRGAGDRSLYVTDNQTAGKGRRGRTWISPKGEDVFFSLLLKPELSPEKASMITLIAALAGVRTVEKYAGDHCSIKWPNDLVLHDKKICGILTEMSADMDGIQYVIPGIGFNLNRMEFDESIQDMASSIRKETGNHVKRSAFLADYIREFMKRYEIFLKEQDLTSFVDEYNRSLINVGRYVKIIQKGREEVRKAIGINHLGELIVEKEDGTKETIMSGEVSVRGLYGYV